MKEETKWIDTSFIISSSYRIKVLKNLETPKTPSHLSKISGINKTHISRTLKELLEKDMIKCLTPEIKKGRIYIISNKGKNTLEETKELN